MNTTEVENFPGFPDGIQGPDLMDDLRRQAERFGAELVADDIDGRRPHRRPSRTSPTAPAPSTCRARSSSPRAPSYRELGLHNEERARRPRRLVLRDLRRLLLPRAATSPSSAAATPRSRRRPSSPGSANTVTLIHRRDELRASQDHAGPRARQPQDASSSGTPRSTDSSASDRLGGVQLRNTKTGAERELDVTGLFVAIGHDPRSDLFAGQVDLDDEGYVQGRTPRPRSPTSPASSPRATSSTTATVRPSPQPAPVAPPPSTPSATSPSSPPPSWPHRRRRSSPADRRTEAPSTTSRPASPQSGRIPHGSQHDQRDRRLLRRRCPQERHARHRGLLGRVVRPCRAVAPILEEIAAENIGTLRVVKVNIDENPKIAASLRHHLHPHDERVLRWRGREADRRRQAEVRPAQGPRAVPRRLGLTLISTSRLTSTCERRFPVGAAVRLSGHGKVGFGTSARIPCWFVLHRAAGGTWGRRYR